MAIETDDYVFNHTMIRVKDIEKSLHFYTECLGMTLVKKLGFQDFSLYFLAKLDKKEREIVLAMNEDELTKYMRTNKTYYLELTHNHGTETTEGMIYKSGNEPEHRGFGHVAFCVPDLDSCCNRLLSMGVKFKKLPHEGSMKNIAFAYDPDGYWVEFIQM